MRLALGYVLAGFVAVASLGCHESDSWGVHGSSSSSYSADGGSREHAIQTITRNGQPFVILVVNGATGGSSSSGGGQAHGEFRRADRSPIAWQCNTTPSGQSVAVVAGRQFDLSQGALLLVDAREETPQFQQHAFDPQQVSGQTVQMDLEKMAAQNAEIATFIEDCWGKTLDSAPSSTAAEPEK